MKNAQFEQEFYKNLPYKPYCTDELGYTFINPKSLAIKKRYLQHNPPCKIVYLVFDIDREDGAMAWHDAGLPLPTWTTQNPENGHAHICYELLGERSDELSSCKLSLPSQRSDQRPQGDAELLYVLALQLFRYN